MGSFELRIYIQKRKTSTNITEKWQVETWYLKNLKLQMINNLKFSRVYDTSQKWEEIKKNRYITWIDKSHKGIEVCDREMKNKYKEINLKPQNKRRLCYVAILLGQKAVYYFRRERDWKPWCCWDSKTIAIWKSTRHQSIFTWSTKWYLGTNDGLVV